MEDWLLHYVRASITWIRRTIIAWILVLDQDRGILEEFGGRRVAGGVRQVRELVLLLIQVLEILLKLITRLRLEILLRLIT